MKNTTDQSEIQFASRHFGKDLVGAPAILMAFGIFLLFAAQFLLDRILHGETARQILAYAALVLGVFALYLLQLFLVQVLKDGKVIWDYSPEYFRIGTWVAGTNVLARVIDPVIPGVGMPLTFAGMMLWLLFMVWLLKMAWYPDLRQKLNGSALLTTVATQSVVLSMIAFWPSAVDHALLGLLGLNLFGLLLYMIWFYGIWIARGFRAQMRDWVPANNITHGALSITVLAAETIAAHAPQPIPYLLAYIQALWIVAACFFIATLLVEIWLVLSKAKNLFSFQIGNYARNFTYGMFFACSYYGYKNFPDSVMRATMSEWLLIALALLVAVVNFWELGHECAGTKTSAALKSWLYARKGLGAPG